jgi:Zn-dependent protease with chaperone function
MKRFSLFALLPLLLLGACAGPVTMGPSVSQSDLARETALQQQMVLERAVADEAKVYGLAYPLLGANAEFCGDYLAPGVGMAVWNIHSVGRANQAAAHAAYGLDDRLAVKTIARASPAQKAGILSGDIIESVNGRALSGATAPRQFEEAVKAAGQGSLALAMRRDGQLRNVTLKPLLICDFPVRVDHNSAAVNAYADGRQIIVTRGMMRFVENDNELVLVLSHELAHNALTHVDKLQQNAMAGSLGGLLIDGIFAAGGVSTNGQFAQMGANFGAGRNSVAFEQEADYVGMYFMERAGYSAADVANFWRRMATENGASVTARTTHPSSPERFLAIEGTYSEIQSKKAKGLPLKPTFTR